MKKAWIGWLCCLTCVTFLAAHEPGEDTTAIDLGSGKVTIHYGTPKLAGRHIDDMIKPGMAWRMGMNDPTTLDTSVDLSFGGKKLAAGKYSLFARLDANGGWTLLVSNQITARLDPASVVAEVPLQVNKDDNPQDVLKISLEKKGDAGSLTVAWGTYRLRGSFEAA